jgi:hypothetical protein
MRSVRFVVGALVCALSVTLAACQKQKQWIEINFPTGPSGTFECNDGRNNDPDEDNLIDILDPGCHWDGNANNPNSYEPTDNSERNGPTSGPPTGFGLNTPMSCVLVNGEYNVSFGWAPSVMGAYRVEFKSSRDGVWRSASELFGSSINGTTFTASRVRADFSHSFRVWSATTLWNTPEEAATCVKVPACRDLGDNDGDGRIDFPADPGCTSREDDDEFDAPPPTGTTPPPGTPPGTTTPPAASFCTGASASLPDLTAKGQTKGFTINSTHMDCHWALRSSNTHIVSTNPAEGYGGASGSITTLNSGTVTIQFIDNPGPTETVMSQRTYIIP